MFFTMHAGYQVRCVELLIEIEADRPTADIAGPKCLCPFHSRSSGIAAKSEREVANNHTRPYANRDFTETYRIY